MILYYFILLRKNHVESCPLLLNVCVGRFCDLLQKNKNADVDKCWQRLRSHQKPALNHNVLARRWSLTIWSVISSVLDFKCFACSFVESDCFEIKGHSAQESCMCVCCCIWWRAVLINYNVYDGSCSEEGKKLAWMHVNHFMERVRLAPPFGCFSLIQNTHRPFTICAHFVESRLFPYIRMLILMYWMQLSGSQWTHVSRDAP